MHTILVAPVKLSPFVAKLVAVDPTFTGICDITPVNYRILVFVTLN